MQRIFEFIVIAIIGITISSGCKKKETPAPDYGMNATVDGVAFSSSECHELGNSSYYTFEGNSYTPGSPSMKITIQEGPGSYLVGTYNIDGITHHATYTPNSSTPASFKAAASGTLTITSMTPGVSIIGTFNFVCTDGTVVSNGSFVCEP